MDSIDGWRECIDRIDAHVLELLNERARCAIKIGEVKTEKGMEVLNPEREKFILDRLRRMNAGPLPDDAVERIFEGIIDECRRAEDLSR